MSKEIRGLRNWIKHISQMELPALANVLRELTRLTEDNEANVNDLSNVILKDSTMTSQIIRAANSVQFNPSGQHISTVSKAIINIGFNEVRSIGLSVSVIDGLLSKNANEQLLKLLAQSFHAATQAKNIAYDLKPDEREEIFIATLLYHLGEMAFFACNLPQVTEYIDRVALDPENENEICRDINGIGFKSITKEIAREWSLGNLLQAAFNTPDKPDKRLIPMMLGEALSRNVAKGWKSEELRQIVAEIGRYTGLDKAKTKELILKGTDDAIADSVIYGAEKICHYIPSREAIDGEKAEEFEPTTLATLQLEYLQKLIQYTVDHEDINTILATTVEALHKSLMLKRATIALIDQKRTTLTARYIAGRSNLDHWRQVFKMPVDESEPAPRDIFSRSLVKKLPFRIDDSDESRDLRYEPLAQILPKGHCFVAPLIANNRAIGVVYADSEGEVLTEKQFTQFKVFANQANLAVSILIH